MKKHNGLAKGQQLKQLVPQKSLALRKRRLPRMISTKENGIFFILEQENAELASYTQDFKQVIKSPHSMHNFIIFGSIIFLKKIEGL